MTHTRPHPLKVVAVAAAILAAAWLAAVALVNHTAR